jgi:hypothetical protein
MLADPGMKARIAEVGGEALTGSPAEFAKLVESDAAMPVSWSLAPRYTASLMDWKLKSRVLIGGTTMATPMSPDSDALTRIARPIASRLLSMTIGLSLKRKFFTAFAAGKAAKSAAQPTTSRRRATSQTEAPGANASATIDRFCSALHRRRRSGPGSTSTRLIALSLAPVQATLLAP